MTAPATTEITKEQWREWMDAHSEWTSTTVIAALNHDSIERGEGPVTKFSAWDGTLEAAETAVKAWIDKPAEKVAQNAPAIHETQSTAPTVPAAPETPTPAPVASVESANVIAFTPPNFQLPRTVTGISILDIGKELNKHLPPQAYGAIKFGQMSGRTDIDGDAVRDRFDTVFGPMMWRIVPQQLAGRVEYSTEIRLSVEKVNGKEVIVDGKPKMKESLYHICTLVAHQFQYALIMPDGSFQWIDGMVTSDLHDNLDQQYAYRGAVTSLMKQFYRLMGGMNHIIYNEYTHEHAARDLASQKRKAS